MTNGEVRQIGRDIGQSHIDVAAYKMVTAFINNRIHEIKVHLYTHDTAAENKKYQPVLVKLEKAEESEYFQVLLERTKKKLVESYESVAEHINIDLINTEYFGFTGRIK